MSQKKYAMVLLALAAGCSTSLAETDELPLETEEAVGLMFASGEADDAYGISDGTYLSFGMVRVVNERSQAQLRTDLGANTTLARNLVDRRTTLGQFSTLTELDAVANTGPVFFARLQAFARENGYVGRCGDARIEGSLETCDDGNNLSGDGCSSLCRIERVCTDPCAARLCGQDNDCGISCGTCAGSCTQAGFCIAESDNAAPRILSITTNRSTLAPNQSLNVVIVATDAQGFRDIAGGELIDETSGRSYAALSPRIDRATYEISISYEAIALVRAPHSANGRGSERREISARFFDQAGHQSQALFAVELNPCSSAQDLLCAGRCVGPSSTTFYRDEDRDGVGGTQPLRSCTLPFGYASTSNDCDDSNAAVQNSRTWYRDLDGDGYGTIANPSNNSIVSCSRPSSQFSYVEQGGDCADRNIEVNPGAIEACNGADDDCDGQADEGCIALNYQETHRIRSNTPVEMGQLGTKTSISRNGNVLVLGSATSSGQSAWSGAASIYEKQGSSWRFVQELISPNPTEQGQFGSALALSAQGDLLFVGAEADRNANNERGLVYVYRRGASGLWTMMQTLVGPPSSNLFGSAVAVDDAGETLLVGASYSSTAYVFKGNSDGFRMHASLSHPQTDTAPYASLGFGDSVAISGNGKRIAVGAHMDSIEGASNWQEGSVLVFDADASGRYAMSAFLTASLPERAAWLGKSIALSGNGATLVAGASIADSGANDSGSATIFEYRSGAWTQTATLVSQAPRAYGWFAKDLAVSTDGQTVWIGEQQTDRVHAYRKQSGSWYLRSSIDAPIASFSFGASLAASGDGSTLAVGAWKQSSGCPGVNVLRCSQPVSLGSSGAVYVYEAF